MPASTDTVAFLRKILATQGTYCAVAFVTQPDGTIRRPHQAFDTPEDLARYALAVDAKGHDVYFAVASFNPPQNKNRNFRIQSNIRAIRSLFLDIDVAKPGESLTDTKYPTQVEAAKALRLFCRDAHLPKPVIVSSGFGLHVYWPMLHDLAVSEFSEAMLLLHAAAHAHGLLFDPVARDGARILRVPGTMNHKIASDPRPVSIALDADPSDFAQYLDTLRQYCNDHGVEVRKPKEKPANPVPELGHAPRTALSEQVEPNVADDGPVPDYYAIAAHCPAVQEFLTADADVPYDLWIRHMAIMLRCQGGAELVHEISSRAGERYDPAETDRQIAIALKENVRPTTCAKMSQSTRICAACPHLVSNPDSSPIRFGYTKDVVRAAKRNEELLDAAVKASQGEVIDPPEPYAFEGDTVVKRVARKDQDGGVEVETLELAPFRFYPESYVRDPVHKRDVWVWRAVRAPKMPGEVGLDAEIEFESALVYDRKLLAQTLSNDGAIVPVQHADEFAKFVAAYMIHAQKFYARQNKRVRMGWQPDGVFVLGGVEYTSEGPRPGAIAKHIRVREHTQPKGSLDKWLRVMHPYNHPDPALSPFKFTLAAGFGSALMRFTHQHGGIINLIGRSGEGKSTLQKVILSIWGNPSGLIMSANHATENAIVSLLNMSGSIVVCAEEMTQITKESLSSLVYGVTQGVEKMRANRSGDVKDSLGGWELLMVSSSNASLHDRLVESGGETAKSLRILEIPVTRCPAVTPQMFREYVESTIIENYGVAGPIYADYLARHQEEVASEVQQCMVKLETHLDLSQEERIWTASIACALVGGKIAYKLGLIPFKEFAPDVEIPMFKFLKQLIDDQRETIKQTISSAPEVLFAFLAESVGKTLVVYRGKDSAFGFADHVPRDEVCVRFDESKMQLAISITALRRWCDRRKQNFTILMSEMRKQRLLVAESVQTNMTQGVRLAPVVVKAVIVNVAHPYVKPYFDEYIEQLRRCNLDPEVADVSDIPDETWS